MAEHLNYAIQIERFDRVVLLLEGVLVLIMLYFLFILLFLKVLRLKAANLLSTLLFLLLLLVSVGARFCYLVSRPGSFVLKTLVVCKRGYVNLLLGHLLCAVARWLTAR